MCLLEADIEDHPAIPLDSVHQAEGGVSQFPVFEDVRRSVERGPLLLPLIGWDAIAVDLKLQEVALELVEPSCKGSHLAGWQHEAAEPEHGTRIVLRVLAAHKGTDVAELVQVRDVVNKCPLETRKPALAYGPRN